MSEAKRKRKSAEEPGLREWLLAAGLSPQRAAPILVIFEEQGVDTVADVHLFVQQPEFDQLITASVVRAKIRAATKCRPVKREEETNSVKVEPGAETDPPAGEREPVAQGEEQNSGAAPIMAVPQHPERGDSYLPTDATGNYQSPDVCLNQGRGGGGDSNSGGDAAAGAAGEDRINIEDRSEGGRPIPEMRFDADSFLMAFGVAVLYFNLKENTKMSKLIDAYCSRTGTDPEQLRFCHEGERFWGTQTAGELRIEDGDSIEVHIMQVGGCIASPVPATFGTYTGSPGIEFLDSTSKLASSTLQDARALINHLGGSLTDSPQVHKQALVLAKCQQLVQYIDQRANHMQPTDDLRLTITHDELVTLLGPDTVRDLGSTFGAPYDTIKLRRARSGCVPFHTDYSKRTMQVALNAADEYEGGKVVFATAAGFVVPPRPVGAATVHVNALVHGASRLQRGTRYSLFLCDTKGQGLVQLDYLVKPALAQFDFFCKAINFLETSTDAMLANSVAEYSRVLRSGGAGGLSFGAEFAWRTHLLHPVRYRQACEALGALHGVIEHTPDLAESYPVEIETSTNDQDATGWCGIDLISAMRRQEGFMRTILDERAHLETEVAAGSAIAGYTQFMHMFKHSLEEQKPTPIVDLMWHTHMLYPQKYAVECRQLAGSFIDHHDDIC